MTGAGEELFWSSTLPKRGREAAGFLQPVSASPSWLQIIASDLDSGVPVSVYLP